ncbi:MULTISPECIES: hypothetical protein [Microvirga]|uniref:Secreted protein n=2 Tax=Microvirga TaxID=186650 RepID=A0ABW9Z609_9HYPH|nr:hypothetical protein [Microvirga arsenatis]NBJ12784.1 hypothetical protein [Microvirga arsenatis]NBJ26643.1 hypothetical protein [Microvirga arsenatis]
MCGSSVSTKKRFRLPLVIALFLLAARSVTAAEPVLPDLLTLCLASLPETTPGQVWSSWSLTPVVVLR